ncbi:MAG: hypothetical protein COA88_09520 [Kordia sp.]|nr:MAG: hypothetical protein COA88_09520 [Kordia sp.]
MSKIYSNIKERILQFAETQINSKQMFFAEVGLKYSDFTGKSKESDLNSKAVAEILLTYKEINPYWLLMGKGEMLLTNSNQQQPIAPTGDLEKDLVAKFANISTRDIAFYSHLKLDTMMEEPVFKALIENLATKRALELLKEK